VPEDTVATIGDDGSFFMTDLQLLKSEFTDKLMAQCYAYITTQMPEWRQNRWNNYANIFLKKQAATPEIWEQNQMDDMVNPLFDDTEQSVYDRCVVAFTWIHDCLTEFNRILAIIVTAQDPATAMQYTITWPEWTAD
jgi:hypothetical protein